MAVTKNRIQSWSTCFPPSCKDCFKDRYNNTGKKSPLAGTSSLSSITICKDNLLLRIFMKITQIYLEMLIKLENVDSFLFRRGW